MNISAGVGGVPARLDSLATRCSRREKWPYIVGRKLMSRATRPRPMTASTTAAPSGGPSLGREKPSVVTDEPDSTNSSPIGSAPRAQ